MTTPEFVARKIRTFSHGNAVRIVGIVDRDDGQGERSVFDDVITRTFVPDQLQVRMTIEPALARELTAALLGSAVEDVTQDDCVATVSEFTNVIAGRLHAGFQERSIASRHSLPRASFVEAAVAHAGPSADHGMTLMFAAGGHPGHFELTASITAATAVA